MTDGLRPSIWPLHLFEVILEHAQQKSSQETALLRMQDIQIQHHQRSLSPSPVDPNKLMMQTEALWLSGTLRVKKPPSPMAVMWNEKEQTFMMTIGTFLTDTFRTPTLPISSNPCLSPFCPGCLVGLGGLIKGPLGGGGGSSQEAPVISPPKVKIRPPLSPKGHPPSTLPKIVEWKRRGCAVLSWPVL